MNAKKTPKPPWSIKAWREERQLSKMETARQLGCSRGALDSWEDGETDTPRYIRLACEAIGAGIIVDADMIKRA